MHGLGIRSLPSTCQAQASRWTATGVTTCSVSRPCHRVEVSRGRDAEFTEWRGGRDPVHLGVMRTVWQGFYHQPPRTIEQRAPGVPATGETCGANGVMLRAESLGGAAAATTPDPGRETWLPLVGRAHEADSSGTIATLRVGGHMGVEHRGACERPQSITPTPAA